MTKTSKTETRPRTRQKAIRTGASTPGQGEGGSGLPAPVGKGLQAGSERPVPVGDSNKLEIALDPAWDEKAQLRRVADNARCPAVRAAISAMPIAKSIVGEVDLTQTLESLKASIAQVQAGSLDQADAMLVAQTETLDSLFHLLVARSNANSREGYLNASETYMRLALKAQAQARANWEAMWRMKQPVQGGTTFIKQANLANGPQQVNNGVTVSETGNRPNELLEGEDG